MLFVDDFIKIYTEAVTVTDSVFMHVKLCIKLYIVNLDARHNSYELVSQHLDEYKNNRSIYKLHEFLTGHI